MRYHIISDNNFFLLGASALLTESLGLRAVVYTSYIWSEKIDFYKILKQKRSNKIILYVNNIAFRRKILNAVAVKGGSVLILSSRKTYKKNFKDIIMDGTISANAAIVVIPSKTCVNSFVHYAKNFTLNGRYHKPSHVELDVIKKLCHGDNISALSERLGKPCKAIYGIKNTVLERTSGVTGVHGLLLCRDIFGV
ncbi:hypothetical protein [Cedecea sp.]|uniref:hypothetical protein n=1 Tax=Cedecea sp. TaxID=1970739 RepID=UPI002F3F1480